MKTCSMKYGRRLVFGAALAGCAACGAVPEVTDVRLAQVGGTYRVNVTYRLSDEAIVTARFRVGGVDLPYERQTSLSGDVGCLVPGGDRSFVWNAGGDWPSNRTDRMAVELTAWAKDAPPTWCAVDLSGGASASAWPVRYYVEAAAVPGGVTNDLYKTTSLLLRKIPSTDACGFQMGNPDGELNRYAPYERAHVVWLTNAYYMAVYETTQEQYRRMTGNSPSHHVDVGATRPVERVSYATLRGTSDGAQWPHRREPDAGSVMGILRAKTGLGFDLPTEAQWEHASRAGTTGSFYVDPTTYLGATGGHYRYTLIQLARSAYTRQESPVGTQCVGGCLPNAWGLYDTIGNVWELCKDRFLADLRTLPGQINPVGPEAGDNIVIRGGSFGEGLNGTEDGRNVDGRGCGCAKRYPMPPGVSYNNVGFRLSVDLE